LVPRLASQAAPSCELAQLVDNALTTAAASGDQPTTVNIAESCEITSHTILRSPGNDRTVWIKLTGGPISRSAAYNGPLIEIAGGLGVIIESLTISGRGSGAADMPNAALLTVQSGGRLELGQGAQLVDNPARAIMNFGSTTLASTTAQISGNQLTAHPDEALPGGAGILNSASGQLIIAAGQITDNTVISTSQQTNGDSGTAPSVIGAGILNLGQMLMTGGQITDNQFTVQAPARSYGGGIGLAVQAGATQAGTATIDGAGQPVIANNQATSGGGIALLGEPGKPSQLVLGQSRIAGNLATTGGAAYIAEGELTISDGAVIGQPANTASNQGNGIYNSAGVLKIAGAPQFADNNGLVAATPTQAPQLIDHLTGSPKSIPLEAVPYYQPADATSAVVARAAAGLNLTEQDLAAFHQNDDRLDLSLTQTDAAGPAVMIGPKCRNLTIHDQLAANGDEIRQCLFTPLSPDLKLLDPQPHDDWRFAGYYDTAQYTNQVVTIPSGTNVDLDLWVRWLALHGVLYVSAADTTGLPVDNAKYAAGDQINLVTGIPQRIGYQFSGWQDQDGAIHQPGSKITMPPGDLTLTAQWQPTSLPSQSATPRPSPSLPSASLTLPTTTPIPSWLPTTPLPTLVPIVTPAELPTSATFSLPSSLQPTVPSTPSRKASPQASYRSTYTYQSPTPLPNYTYSYTAPSSIWTADSLPTLPSATLPSLVNPSTLLELQSPAATASLPSVSATQTQADVPLATPVATRRAVIGWSLVGCGTLGLGGLASYWVRRLRPPRL
jgi:uncharacterized repeat protein (TIGR02543 family)